MEIINDSDDITNINNNYQGIKINKGKYKISDNFKRIKDETNKIINSNNKNEQKYLKDILDSNLLVPSVFKNKRIDKLFNASKNISSHQILKLFENKTKINKNDILLNNNNDYNIKNSPRNIQNNISFNINVQNNIFNNQYDNISGRNNSEKNILNKKRKLNKEKVKEKEKENIKENENEIKTIYKEIKNIYNDFIKNNEIEDKQKQNIIIYENKRGYFERQETIVIKNPVCVIYFNREDIKNIFLIKEEKMCDIEEEIKFVLEQIKSEIQNLIEELLE